MKEYNYIWKDWIKVLKINLNPLETFKIKNFNFNRSVNLQEMKLVKNFKKYIFILISKYLLQNKKRIVLLMKLMHLKLNNYQKSKSKRMNM